MSTSNDNSRPASREKDSSATAPLPPSASAFDRAARDTTAGYDEFVQHLYKENSALRSKLNTAQRELFNQRTQLDAAEDELRQLQNTRSVEDSARSQESVHRRGSLRPIAVGGFMAQVSTMLSKELEETKAVLERKNNEIKQLKEDLSKEHELTMKQKTQIELVERELLDTKDELTTWKQKRATRRSSVDAENTRKEAVQNNVELENVTRKFNEAQDTIHKLKKQVIHIVNEGNRRNSEQQNQLQGVEMMVDHIRREYEEFFDINKAEHESYRKIQQEEMEKLRTEFETFKHAQFEDKRRIILQYQTLLYSMQNQFEEYRTVSEFLFNGEIAKIEDELATLALRYEQECLYVIQAKDKFFMDLMVAKDAKIMHLIEGSDMQGLLRKHEIDIENVRKEHAKEVERVKTDQESEQKNLVNLLQRQNSSLEAKFEKLQSHIKTLETKMRDLNAIVDQKNRQILEKDQEKLRTDDEHRKYQTSMEERMRTITQEKEHLRHQAIRLKFNARGEGSDSVENIIKRITREQTELSRQYEDLTEKYRGLVKNNELLGKKLREKEKLTQFLDKEIGRRNHELESMTKTFEVFLQSRTKQTAMERKQKMKQLATKENAAKLAKAEADTRIALIAPASGHAPASKEEENRALHHTMNHQQNELERGYAYLRRFKTLSRAFVSGDYRKIQLPKDVSTLGDDVTGPWQNTPLYAKLAESSQALAKIYGAQNTSGINNKGVASDKLEDLVDIATPSLYIPKKGSYIAENGDIKLYSEENHDSKVEYKKNVSFTVDGKRIDM